MELPYAVQWDLMHFIEKGTAKIDSYALRSRQFTSGESKGGVIERVCPD